MGSFKTLVFVVFFCALLSPKNIFAEVHNHNGHNQKEITSPFEVKKEKNPLHCLLKIHALILSTFFGALRQQLDHS